MYKRDMQQELLLLAKQYPVVTITGPRQSGKTTLTKLCFPGKPYINLEAPDIRERAHIDPRGFLMQFPDGAILDEIQRAPELLSYIQILVDQRDEKGYFILTGSHQLQLHSAITQSLAGRTALLTLLPMSLVELQEAGIDLPAHEAIFRGGYPRIFKDHLDPTTAYRNYFQTYVERDLRQLIHVKDLAQFQKFIKLTAGRIAQLVNFESLANEVGVSANTIKEWISILEASYIILRLHPYFENFGKRFIKAPKLYFTDVGFACYLLGIENSTQLERDPLRGNLFENLIFLELVKSRLNHGRDTQLYYVRDAHNHEIDFLFQAGRDLVAIEVKSSSTFNKSFLDNLLYYRQIFKERMKKSYIIYGGREEITINETTLLPYGLSYKSVTGILA